ncbi:IPT/TIG domain-containing protein [uncultured Allomuricauda sp.]|uniref:IPT/TIG domain-containing protein n=1 Tax=Flagellimonas sp. W118 TaxID=3410791 RepID=UPI00262AEE7E|nr:IPT/TIG domain-containing protein [uncultured Allomuricauda sp.]
MKTRKLSVVGILFTLMLIGIGCSNEFNQNDAINAAASGPPSISSVRDVNNGSDVETGVLGNTLNIKGSNLKDIVSVKFNGFEATVNPNFATQNVIVLNVPLGAPVIGSNKLIVETLHGVAEYDFSLLTIDSFSEEIIDGVSAVILEGGDFSGASSASFVNGVGVDGPFEEIPTEIINVSEEELAIAIPGGIVQGFVQIEVNGAVAQSTSYGFNYPIFTDAIINDWQLGGWDGTQVLSDEITLGSTSIRRDSNNWAGLTFSASDTSEKLTIAEFSALNFQIFPANPQTVRVACALNDFDTQVVLNLVPGEWNSFSIPLTDFYAPGTAPETITRIDFQEFSGGTAPFLFYLDQFGLIQ